MALVDYVSSSSDGGDDDEAEVPAVVAATAGNGVAEGSHLKRKRRGGRHTDEEGGKGSAVSSLPPLPSKFHDLYASTTRVSTRDDPSLHGGRKRVTPHVEGNWPSHLFIEWYPATAESELLSQLISSVGVKGRGSRVESFLASDLGAPLPLHISLSRPIGFLTNVKDQFVDALQQKIRSSGVRPFEASFLGLDWVPNFENTRWFLVLRVSRPEDNGLNKLLATCNSTVEEFGQPPLYIDHSAKVQEYRAKRGKSDSGPAPRKNLEILDHSNSFHVSIGWSLEPPSENMITLVKKFVGSEGFDDIKSISFGVDHIKAKIGNVVTSITLQSKVTERNVLFGL